MSREKTMTGEDSSYLDVLKKRKRNKYASYLRMFKKLRGEERRGMVI